MTSRIIVINPNSDPAVTASIDSSMVPLRSDGLGIDVIGLADGPRGIENQTDIEVATPLILRCIAKNAASAYVIACYADPGLHAAREVTSSLVFGIAESGILTALTLGSRFGIIAILQKAIRRHTRYVGAMGLTGRFAGDRSIESGVGGLSDESRTFQRMCEVGVRLRDDDGADVLVLGCAGMGRHRANLSAYLGIPVVDPTQAAVAAAIGRVRLGW